MLSKYNPSEKISCFWTSALTNSATFFELTKAIRAGLVYSEVTTDVIARGLYVLTTCAVVLMALSFLNLGGH